jgi:hypothetical protein
MKWENEKTRSRRLPGGVRKALILGNKKPGSF